MINVLRLHKFFDVGCERFWVRASISEFHPLESTSWQGLGMATC